MGWGYCCFWIFKVSGAIHPTHFQLACRVLCIHPSIVWELLLEAVLYHVMNWIRHYPVAAIRQLIMYQSRSLGTIQGGRLLPSSTFYPMCSSRKLLVNQLFWVPNRKVDSHKMIHRLVAHVLAKFLIATWCFFCICLFDHFIFFMSPRKNILEYVGVHSYDVIFVVPCSAGTGSIEVSHVETPARVIF